MGAKSWMLAYSDGDPAAALRAAPALDRDASLRLAAALFPGETLTPLADVDLTCTNPRDDEIVVGVFPGVSIVAAKEFGIDYPSRLQRRFLEHGRDGAVHLFAMHSVVDWFAFAIWRQGRLVRALSLAPDNGILEDTGDRQAFEAPFWAGSRDVEHDEENEDDDYPLPFHPLEFGEVARREFFAHVMEGEVDPDQIEPGSVPLLHLRRRRAWWKFWK